MLLLALIACDGPDPGADAARREGAAAPTDATTAPTDADAASDAFDGGGIGTLDGSDVATALAFEAGALRASRRVVLDRGRLADGAWISEPLGGAAPSGEAAPTGAGAAQGASRAADTAWTLDGAPIGAAPVPLRRDDVVIVRRGACPEAPVRVPVRLDATDTVSVPYPACDAAPPAGAPATVGELAALQAIGLFAEVPALGPDDEPAGWFTHAEAEAWCAWWGGRLPSRAELVGAPAGGATWLAEGDAPPGLALAAAPGEAAPRELPPAARMPEVGVRCGPARGGVAGGPPPAP